MTLLPEMLLAGTGMKKMADAWRRRTDRRRQSGRSLFLKTRGATGPNTLPSTSARNPTSRRIRQRFLAEVPVLHVEALPFGGGPLLGVLLGSGRGDNDGLPGLPE